jgi:hypothetical protein
MTVDFVVKRAPGYTVASITRIGPWRENTWRPELSQIEKWARKRKLRTGKYILREFGSGNRRRWEACIEIRGKASSEGKVRIKSIPAEMVAAVTFNPRDVSPRLVYHGLNDWTRWRVRDRTFRKIVSNREVYNGNPWTNPRAWAKTEVQYVVRKRK